MTTMAIRNVGSFPVPSLSIRDESPSPRKLQRVEFTCPLHDEDARRRLSALQQIVNDNLDASPPQLAEEGLGGTYFLRDGHGIPIAVCKPANEEPYAPGMKCLICRQP